jgi:hypothetical protein
MTRQAGRLKMSRVARLRIDDLAGQRYDRKVVTVANPDEIVSGLP